MTTPAAGTLGLIVTREQQTSNATNHASTNRLVYPVDLLDKQGYFVEISAMQPISADNPRGVGGVETRRKALASVYLPIPLKFTEGLQEYEFDTTGSIYENLARLGQGSSISGLIERGVTALNMAASYNQLTINYGFYVAFKKPKFKQWEMSWMFIPRNPSESAVVHNICTWFKFFSAAAKDQSPAAGLPFGGSVTLPAINMTYPNEFRMRYLFSPSNGQVEDVVLPRPQLGYIVAIEVSHYAEDGASVGFFTGTKNPAVTVLSFLFQENEYQWKNDYAEMPIYEASVPTGNRSVPNFNSDHILEAVELPAASNQRGPDKTPSLINFSRIHNHI